MTRRQGMVATALLFSALTAPASTPTSAVPAEVAAELPGATLQGHGTLRFFGFQIYQARLWSGERPVSPGDWTAVPLALELEYQRSFDGAKVAERSLAEMRRQAEIPAADAERWLAAMTRLFPDVRAGDRITGLLRPGDTVRVFVNGALRGELRDAAFARLFFGIWLSPRTSEPALRNALLGTAASGAR